MQMMDDLITAIEENKSDKRLRSIMITAATGHIFCAGHNLKELVIKLSIQLMMIDDPFNFRKRLQRMG
jgi:enoyl-CoA hydratase/carnithine racemase